MSNGQEDVSSQPLVIVRRRRNTDEEHHGGVWKIAYADFMTAMMAFFLVMWLINAADKKTIVQVAAYFNPMRLTDRFDAPKGLDDLSEMESKQAEEKAKKGSSPQLDKTQKLEAPKPTKDNIGEAMDEEAKKTSAGAGGKSAEAQKEEALFDNPGQLLDKLADEAKASQAMTAAAPSDGAMHDPFDRIDRRAGKMQTAEEPLTQPHAPAPATSEKASAAAPSAPAIAARNTKTTAQSGQSESPQKPAPPAAKNDQAPASVAEKDATPVPGTITDPQSNRAAVTSQPSGNPATGNDDLKAQQLQADIKSALAKVSNATPGIEVKATSEGMLVSLLDDANFGMFEVGSAKPRPALVLVMSKLGDVLKAQPGAIVVRGHTDSRAYKNGNYDNWRLSVARAQMAYYMLVRGGVSETRFVAIEGRADRDPKIPAHTEAAQNRRIDILIKEDKK